MQEGAAVVDAHNHGLPVLQIGNSRVARKLHRGVRRGHFVHVVDFARGSLFAVELLSVPRAVTDLGQWLIPGHRHVPLSHHRIRTIGRSDRFFNFGHGICTTHTESLPFFGRTVSIVVFTAVFLRAAAAHKKHKRSCAHPEDSYIHKSSSVVFIQSGTVIVAVQRNFDAPLC